MSTLVLLAQAMATTASNFVTLNLFSSSEEHRDSSEFQQRLDWGKLMRTHGNRRDFQRHLPMSRKSFEKLLSYVKDDLLDDDKMASLRGGSIIPEIRLYCTLRWLAGGSYLDILLFTGMCFDYDYIFYLHFNTNLPNVVLLRISKSSFYQVIWGLFLQLINVNS